MRAKPVLVSLLASACLGLGLVGGVQVQPALAAPAAVPIPTFEAALVDGASTVLAEAPDGTMRSCVLVSPGVGYSSDIVGYLDTAYLGHGYPTRDDQKLICPSTFQVDTQSALGFTPMAPAAAVPGQPFLLGRVQHNNNVIWSGGTDIDTYLSGALQIAIGPFNDAFPFTLTETGNVVGGVPTDVDDVAVFNDVRSTQIITTAEGLNYRLIIAGFRPSTGTCSESPLGPISSTFVTKEKAITYGCLYGQWEQERPLVIRKLALDPDAIGAPIPAFGYETSVSIGEPWSAFTLQPAAFGADGAVQTEPHMLLAPGDSATVTESLPIPVSGQPRWLLDSVDCVDGLGASVGGVTINGQSVSLANLPMADVAAAATITCTFTNLLTPAPKASLHLRKLINGSDANLAPGVVVDPTTDMNVTFEVYNDGLLTVRDVSVIDDLIPAASITAPATVSGGGSERPYDGTLAPGETAVFTALFRAPALGAQHTNVAHATAVPLDPESQSELDPISSNEDPANAVVAGITLVKSVAAVHDVNNNGLNDAGDLVSYSFVVTNPSRITLTNTVLTDGQLGLVGSNVHAIGDLAPGATTTVLLTDVYTITTGDQAAGFVKNVATVTGDDGEPAVTDPTATDVAEVVVQTSVTPTPSPSPTPTPSPTPDPEPSPVRGLPRTGADSGLAGALLTFALIGSAVLAARRERE